MKSPLICIVGPTAVGKTEIAIQLAQHLDAEIVSLDSRQIYREMDIGTAKPTPDQRGAVPHHLIDCVDVDQPFSVAEYQRLADVAITEIWERGKRTMAVGGAGLYFRGLIDGLFDGPGADAEIRSKLQREAEEHGNVALHEQLRRCDPETADRVHPNNRVKVIRALEVYELTGKPISALQQQWKRNKPRYPFRAFGLNMPREMLYRRIEDRVEEMVEAGLIAEVKGLLDQGYPRSCVAMQSFGYKELIEYLDGKRTLDEGIALLKQNTRRFAKRQLTWFCNDLRIEWLDISQFSSIDRIVDNLLAKNSV
ncbi:tRNA (adenosine(37)-N6)-dimethylallyltransferase MiaA [Candidatus Poribacteria bacterium]|nr:MAG: tRNA (adenosine(37)-N6)-dimethylallyltransferase MiaA [Candidatus Poribacteria bacterium]